MNALSPRPVQGNGVYRHGIGARSMSMAGADAAWSRGAMDALAANPAGLTTLEQPTLDLGMTLGAAQGEFRNRANGESSLRNSWGAIPDAAFGLPLGQSRFTAALGLLTDAALRGRWSYFDTPGGADGGTSYGRQNHHSDVLLLRAPLAVAWELNPYVSLGGSVALLYNENNIQVPYIFQNHPALNGFKTLLDLSTSGFGWNGQAGLLVRPHADWQIGITYKSSATLNPDGDASGNASAQLRSLGGNLAAAQPDFHYNAEIETQFPHIISLGVSWKPASAWRLAVQADWINWADAFDNLPITLTDGTNPDLNAVLGSNRIDDTIPLGWRDRWVYRAGVEYALSAQWTLRTGYAFGESPIPSEWVTPLNASILEHTISAGVGYEVGRYRFDLAYQWNLPNEESVDLSGYRAGEYSASTVDVSVHWIGLTSRIRF
jgi:long-chain fatty acid transport protein